jgi:hypothetical protein
MPELQERLVVQPATVSSVPTVRVGRQLGKALIDYLSDHLRLSFSCENMHFTIYFLDCTADVAQAWLDKWMDADRAISPATHMWDRARLSSWIVG